MGNLPGLIGAVFYTWYFKIRNETGLLLKMPIPPLPDLVAIRPAPALNI